MVMFIAVTVLNVFDKPKFEQTEVGYYLQQSRESRVLTLLGQGRAKSFCHCSGVIYSKILRAQFLQTSKYYMEVSSSENGGTPWSLDGLFHGKSLEMDDN